MQHLQHLVQKALKKARKLLSKRRSPLFFLFFGLIIFSFGAINYYRVRILSFSKVPEAVIQSVNSIDTPVELIIPSIQIDLKIEPGQVKDGVWLISDSNATFLNTSAGPGSGGNTVIYGHNKTSIFGNLPYLSIGQKISIKTKSGKIYNYVANEKYFVGPDRVDLVSPKSGEMLTIYTCWGLFDSQRAVVIAKPI